MSIDLNPTVTPQGVYGWTHGRDKVPEGMASLGVSLCTWQRTFDQIDGHFQSRTADAKRILALKHHRSMYIFAGMCAVLVIVAGSWGNGFHYLSIGLACVMFICTGVFYQKFVNIPLEAEYARNWEKCEAEWTPTIEENRRIYQHLAIDVEPVQKTHTPYGTVHINTIGIRFRFHDHPTHVGNIESTTVIGNNDSNLVGDLERLYQLYQNGALNEVEYQLVKSRLLQRPPFNDNVAAAFMATATAVVARDQSSILFVDEEVDVQVEGDDKRTPLLLEIV
jgi:hypothetical protein